MYCFHLVSDDELDPERRTVEDGNRVVIMNTARSNQESDRNNRSVRSPPPPYCPSELFTVTDTSVRQSTAQTEAQRNAQNDPQLELSVQETNTHTDGHIQGSITHSNSQTNRRTDANSEINTLNIPT